MSKFAPVVETGGSICLIWTTSSLVFVGRIAAVFLLCGEWSVLGDIETAVFCTARAIILLRVPADARGPCGPRERRTILSSHVPVSCRLLEQKGDVPKAPLCAVPFVKLARPLVLGQRLQLVCSCLRGTPQVGR